MLTTKSSKVVFEGNGIATDFPFPFKVWEAAQLLVQVTDLQESSVDAQGWTVQLFDAQQGGTVRYWHDGAPLPTGYKLTILRNMPFLQEVDLITGTRFDPQVIEEQLDKATAERQQLFEALERAVKTPASSVENPEDFSNTLFTARNAAMEARIQAEAAAQESRNLAQQTQENTLIATENAQLASQKAEEAQNWAEQASTDVTGAVDMVKAAGEKQLLAIEVASQETQRMGIIPNGLLKRMPLMFTGYFGGSDGKRPINVETGLADENFVLCDGTNGTPNLVDRFILGANGTVSESMNIYGGDTETEPHTLTIDELPNHRHTTTHYTTAGSAYGIQRTSKGSSSDQSFTSYTGGSEAHTHGQNLPPYYTLAFIMKYDAERVITTVPLYITRGSSGNTYQESDDVLIPHGTAGTLYIDIPSIYAASGTLSGSTDRRLYVRINGVTVVAYAYGAVSPDTGVLMVSINDGDIVEWYTYQEDREFSLSTTEAYVYYETYV